MSRYSAVALVGATGSGKSALAMRLDPPPALIIACDSMQLYRGLDIGTAKPTRAERTRIPHAMIDVLQLPQTGDAAWWAARCRELIGACNARGVIPLIVGGTGLYLRALLQGLAEIPPERPEIRRRLEAIAARRGIAWLHHMLRRLDPESAARLAGRDRQRILRALAVRLSSGQPLSEWQRRPASPFPLHCPVFVLEVPRPQLYPKLEQRFHAMIAQGWIEEVRWLASLGLDRGHPAMRAVGYRQLLQHIRGALPLEEAIAAGITATRRYAKRQQTWFRHQHPGAIHGDGATLKPMIEQALHR
ncbi:MAG: tRNA (adenosine(37)-N6)-dimethylallyltransferase MiaA [Zetaproteobacteria bacterium]|nr:MAG: tRNA (adenosine(37)-N6)-dimethylallyltransferase MiaA [Zetaproteobacteria bacterium]